MMQKLRSTISQRGEELLKEFRRLTRPTKPKRVLFDHLSKCGGNSVIFYLQSQYPGRKIHVTDGLDPWRSVEAFKSYSISKRHGYELIAGHLAGKLRDFAHPETLIVTLIREPVERFISHFYYFQGLGPEHRFSRVESTHMTLDEFVEFGEYDVIRNYYTCTFSGLSPAEADRAPEEAVARALEVCAGYDLVGRLCAVESFLKALYEMANLYSESKNPAFNVNVRRPSPQEISRATRQRIAEVNALDMAFYRLLEDFAV
jgi:Sulfotransferase family